MAELGQAQLQLELGFTLIKVCCIILMITNYHYKSLSTISLWTWLLPLTCILAYLIDSFHACLLREAFELKNVRKSGKSPHSSWPPPSPRKFWTFLNLGKKWKYGLPPLVDFFHFLWHFLIRRLPLDKSGSLILGHPAVFWIVCYHIKIFWIVNLLIEIF